eukprot:1451632-Prymnesium_polylepis.2
MPPSHGARLQIRRMCEGSPASHCAVVTTVSLVCTICHSSAAPRDSVPPRDVSTSWRTPRCASHRPVSRPSPPVPPVTMCTPPEPALRAAMRITNLPVFSPP